MGLRAGNDVDAETVCNQLEICCKAYGKQMGDVERYKSKPLQEAIAEIRNRPKGSGRLTEHWVNENINGEETKKKVRFHSDRQGFAWIPSSRAEERESRF